MYKLMELIKNQKPNITITVIGPFSSGKSTLCGYLCYHLKSDHLPEVKADDITQEGIANGRAKSMYPWFFDTSSFEKLRNITFLSLIKNFQTDKLNVSICDTPGLPDFKSQMIRYISIADVIILVIPVTLDYTDENIQSSLIEYLFLIKAHLLTRFFIVVNKMDLVSYTEKLYLNIHTFLINLLNTIFVDGETFFIIPSSAENGENLIEKSNKMTWYKDKSLFELLNAIPKPERLLPTDNLQFLIVRAFSVGTVEKTTIVIGIVIRGTLKLDSNLFLSHAGINFKALEIQNHFKSVNFALPGDFVGIRINVLPDSFEPGLVITQNFEEKKNGKIIKVNMNFVLQNYLISRSSRFGKTSELKENQYLKVYSNSAKFNSKIIYIKSEIDDKGKTSYSLILEVATCLSLEPSQRLIFCLHGALLGMGIIQEI